MLLCIEVYPSGVINSHQNDGTITSIHPPPPQLPSIVQYVSLAGSSAAAIVAAPADGGITSTIDPVRNNDTTGIVWKLGRRSGNYQLTSDKSVSREHSIIRIATTNQTYLGSNSGSGSGSTSFAGRSQSQQQQIDTSVSSMDRTPMMATTPQMLKACDQAIDNLCVVVENVGKLGTFIIHEYYDDDENDNRNDKNRPSTELNDADNDDSETDDEMDIAVKTQKTNYGISSSSNYQGGSSFLSSQVPNQQNSSTITNMSLSNIQNLHNSSSQSQLNSGIILSPITEYLLQQSGASRSTVQQIVGVPEFVVLDRLTWTHHQQQQQQPFMTNNNIRHRPRRVIIQVGKMGSTIVITRMPPIYLYTSGTMAKTAINFLQSQLYKIGARELLAPPPSPTNTTSSGSNNNNINNNHHHQVPGLEFNVQKILEDTNRVVPWDKNNQNDNENCGMKDDVTQIFQKYYYSCSDCCYMVITSQYAASMKQLLAWSCGIPIVQPSLIHELLQHNTMNVHPRTNHNHDIVSTSGEPIIFPLPLPKNHIPKLDTNSFWNYQTIQPNSKLWKGLTYLSLPKKLSKNLQENANQYDLEQLILSAGCTIVRVTEPTDQDDKVFMQQINEILSSNHEDDAEQPPTIFFIIFDVVKNNKSTLSKYEKMIMKQNDTILSKKKKVVGSNCPGVVVQTTTTKMIAQCITTQTLLFPELQQQQQQQERLRMLEQQKKKKEEELIRDDTKKEKMNENSIPEMKHVNHSTLNRNKKKDDVVIVDDGNSDSSVSSGPQHVSAATPVSTTNTSTTSLDTTTRTNTTRNINNNNKKSMNESNDNNNNSVINDSFSTFASTNPLEVSTSSFMIQEEVVDDRNKTMDNKKMDISLGSTTGKNETTISNTSDKRNVTSKTTTNRTSVHKSMNESNYQVDMNNKNNSMINDSFSTFASTNPMENSNFSIIIDNNNKEKDEIMDCSMEEITATTTEKGTTKKRKNSVLPPGWLQATIKGKQRNALVRSTEEIRTALGVDDIRDVAPTDIVKGLIVLSTTNQQSISTSSGYHTTTTTLNHTSQNNGGGVNYKAFRKNVILTVTSPQTIVRYKSVLPNESSSSNDIQNRDMDEQRNHLEEQQRLVDELFQDSGRNNNHNNTSYTRSTTTSRRNNQRR